MRAQAPGVLLQRSKNPEKEYWENFWKDPTNKEKGLGEDFIGEFLQNASISTDSRVLEFGCGNGVAGLMIAALSGATIDLVDCASNCLDSDVESALTTQDGKINFIEHDLFNPLTATADYGFSAGLFDSIGKLSDLLVIFKNCIYSVGKLFFVVNLTEEKPFKYWVHFLNYQSVVTYLAKESGKHGIFLVSRWQDAIEFRKEGTTNIPQEEINKNILTNITKGFSQVIPHLKQSREVIILGGGPSLNDFIDDIKEKREAGAALITVNGSYKWALDHGLVPSAQIIVDAREFNKKFLDPIIPNCKYLLSSQCHPNLFDIAPKEKTLLWHVPVNEEIGKEIEKYYEVWHPIPGGSTSVLRSIILLRILGYHNFHIYGFDSCYVDDKHHAYDQPENNDDGILNVSMNDKVFRCAPWMVCQAQEFMFQSEMMGDEINIAVYGDGLIANIISAAIQEN